MIQGKMDLTAVITCLNEFEKLKLLLFDDDQYILFSHIPKPFLINPNLALQEEEASDTKDPKYKKTETSGSKDQDILMSNNSFWK